MSDIGAAEAARDRAGLDSRAAFVVASFAASLGAILLVDRIGAPGPLVTALAVGLVAGGLAAIGLASGALRASRFDVAGRRAPAPYAGLAFAALSCGLLAPFAPPAPGVGPWFGAAASVGCLALALLLGPMLRASGAVSTGDLAAARYHGRALRLWSAAATAAICVATLVAGLELAATSLVGSAGLSRAAALALAAAAAAAIVAPGGLGGVVWASAAAAGLAACGYAVTLAESSLRPGLPPLFAVDGLIAAGAARLAAWGAPSAGSALAFAGLALGVFAQPFLLGPAIAAPDAASARRAGWLGLGAGALLALAAAAAMAIAALSLDSLAGQRLDRLPAW
ncbi:MAG: sodium:solute symporter, partial [Methylobacteriaceae bacterium]|nr:sodium:solute symporter [Methylobacteriaceae bacterium]